MSTASKVHEKGLYQKYEVRRLQDPDSKHEDCDFFVLDLTHDRFAKRALATYARDCETTHPQLAEDLWRKIDAMDPIGDRDRDEAQTKVSKGGTNMRAAGEKPDPVEAEGCVAGNRSEGTFNEGEKRGEDPVGSGLSSDAGKAKAAFSLGRTSELGTDSAQSCPAPFESRTCTGAPRNCNGCGRLILLENLFCDDGCPCNSSRGINLKPQPCDICHDTLCVKPGHRITELFGVPDPRRESAPKWPTVDTFASVMRTKLDLNDHKGGWHGDAPHHLLARACEEMSELVTALNPRTKEANRNFDMAGQYLHNAAETLREFGECLTFSGRKSEVMDEAADVANMVMMVADVFGGTQRMANATTEEKK